VSVVGPSLLLDELLALPRWAEAVQLLHRGSHPSRISRFNLTSDSRSASSPGSLVCLTSAELPTWQISALVRGAADNGVSGVLVPSRDVLDVPAIRLAARFDVTLLAVTDETSIMDLVVEARVYLAAGELASSRILLRLPAALELDDVGASISAAAQLLDATIVLTRSSGTVISAAGPDADNLALPTRAGRSVDSESRLEVFSHAITLPGRTVHEGWLAVAAPIDPGVSTAGYASLPMLVSWARFHLASVLLARERDLTHDQAVVAGIDPVVSAVEDDDRWFVGLRISHSLGKVEEDFNRILAAFDVEGFSPILVKQGAGWSGWIAVSRGSVKAAMRLRQRLESVIVTTGLRAGIGTIRKGTQGRFVSIEEAALAGEVAALRHVSGGGLLLSIDELSDSELVLLALRMSAIRSAAMKLLGGAVAVPELLRTLRVYLDQQSSLVDTAAVLGVHRNTVAGRITRLQELVSVDLGTPDGRLAALLAVRAFGESDTPESPR